VTLSDNNAALTGPASVSVAAGATTATFTATAGSVTANQSVTITATLSGSSTTAAVTITAPLTVSKLQCSPTSVTSGASSTCTVTLSLAAPSGGSVVAISDNSSALTTPASVTVAASATTATFLATAGSVTANQSVTVAAALNGNSTTTTVTVTPSAISVSTLQCFPTSVRSGSSVTCTVTLSRTAPSGGTVVALSDNSAALTIPSSVKVATWFSSATFTASAGSVTGNQSATIVAALNGSSATTTLTISPKQRVSFRSAASDGTSESPQPANAVSALSCSPGAVNAGAQITCELRVTASPVALQLGLASSSEQVKVPAAVTTRPNQSSLTFQVFAEPIAKQQSAIITATLDDSQVQETIVVGSAVGPVLTVPDKQNAKLGAPVSFTVSAVDPGGLPVQLAVGGVPAGASFDPASGRFDWVPSASQTGRHQITFTAVNSLAQTSTAQTTIEVDSGAPVLSPSKQFACSPNSVASLTGKWLAAPGPAVSDPTGNAMELGGTKVKVNGQQVPVIISSATRVSFLCPALDPGTPLSVAVETGSGATEPVTTTMLEASPTILSLEGRDRAQGVISFPGTTDLVMMRNFRVAAHPAQPGDQILIWASGLGSAAEASSGTVLVKLGDIAAEVEAVNAVPGLAGVYTIQVRVPVGAAFGDAVPVQVQIATPSGGQFNSNTVTAVIEPVRQ
jgi:uncharacterized protein (TIGR03437 family)